MEIYKRIQVSIFGLIFLFGSYFAYDPAACIQCRESHMCNPPECFCCRDKMPLQTHTIPQMVFFTFDDAVNPQVANYYRKLFSPKRRNPNGCPISMTLFVSHRNTVYGLVKEFYKKGMEIASHSVTHSHMNTNTFIREAKKQKENLSKRAGIPSDKIVGWRSPFLEPVGDLQPSVLKDLGYEYDATLTMAKKTPKDKAITPFTLDFGWPYDCKIKPCPTKSHKGFWEVPVVSVKDYLDKYDCVYVDGCNNPPPTENLAYKFLWDNFQKYYTTNRAPMGINMHASWFYYPERKAAMDRFIKKLVTIDDVYIVSVKQVIEWLRNPTSLQQIKTFQPWQCNGNATSTSQTGNVHFDSRSHRRRLREGTFRPQNTRIGNFISNAPRPSNPSRPWQTPRPQRQPLVPTSMPPAVPPMVPNLPMVRFWWRPPNMADPAMQQSMHMQEQQRQATLRQRRLEEERLQRIKAEEQARLLDQKRQEELKQQELARQAELLKRQHEKTRQEEMQLRQRKLQEMEKQRQLSAGKQNNGRLAGNKQGKKIELVKRQELNHKRQDLVHEQQLTGFENEYLQMQQTNNGKINAPVVQQPLVKLAKSQNLLQNEFLQAQEMNSRQINTTGVNPDDLLQNEFIQIPETHSQQPSVPNAKQRFVQGKITGNLLQNEFLQSPKVNNRQPSVPGVKQAQVQATNSQSSLLNEFLQPSGTDTQTNAPVVLQQHQGKVSENSLQNEFLQSPQINNRQPSAPGAKQAPVQGTNSQNFQDTLRSSSQLQKEVDQQRFAQTTQTTPTTTLDHQKVLEESFKRFISMKLDEILQYHPNERTKQLELLSIDELRALQQELRNRLLKDNMSKNQNQSKSVNEQSISVSAKHSQPFQNEIQPQGKPMMNEFHNPNDVQITKLNEFQTNELVQQEVLKDYSVSYTDPVVTGPVIVVSDKALFQMKGQIAVPLQSAVFTTRSPVTTTGQIPIKNTTQNLTTKIAYPTTQAQTLPTTSTIPAETTTTGPIATSPTEPVSTTKAIIPVVQRWTALHNMKVPWQQWITEVPNPAAKPQTTTPGPPKTRNPTDVHFFTVKNMVKTSNLFNDQSFHPLLSGSDILNEISVQKENAKNMQTSVKEIRQPPKAFVNAPLHFDIDAELDKRNKQGRFSGISLDINRFKPPVMVGMGSVQTSSPGVGEKVEKNRVSLKPVTFPLPTTTITTTTSAAEVSTEPKHSHRYMPHTVLTESSNLKQTQLQNNVKFIAQDVFNVVDKYIISDGKASKTPASDITQNKTESKSPAGQPVFDATVQSSEHLSPSSQCLQQVNCMRPDCVCQSTTPPNGISLADTPQIVYITVDGSLNFHTYGKMRALFSSSRKNPNGCRIKGTVFVTDTGSSYRIADVLQNAGVELAMMGVSSRPYLDSKKLKKDLVLQRKRISTSANIAKNDVKGWRSPGFSPVGDEQFDILANQSLYDASLLVQTDVKNQPIPWPYTLDFGWNHPCETGTCPRQRHSGLWEVPAIPFIGPKNSTACEYVDACAVQPETKQETVDYLMKNFIAYYKTNKAPFAIRLKQIWFHWYYRENFAGLIMFLDKILGLGDVYITSVSDTIEWMKSPTSLKDLRHSNMWKC